jgi:hypothetical protein
MRSCKLTTASLLLCGFTACFGSNDPAAQTGQVVDSEQGAASARTLPGASGVDPTAGSSATTSLAPGARAEPAGHAVVVAAATQIAGGSLGDAAAIPVTTAPSAAIARPPGAAKLAPPTMDSSRSTTAAQPEQAALASLETLSLAVSRGKPGRRGFGSAADVRSASLGTPLHAFVIGLDDLRAYQPGQDPRSVLTDKQEIVYPLVTNGEIRSSVVVRHRDDGAWETVQFGRGVVVKDIHAARASVAARRNRNTRELSLVEVPTLALRFLAHDESGGLWLSPVHDVPGTALRAHDSYPASEVLRTLQPLAARVGAGNQ